MPQTITQGQDKGDPDADLPSVDVQVVTSVVTSTITVQPSPALNQGPNNQGNIGQPPGPPPGQKKTGLQLTASTDAVDPEYVGEHCLGLDAHKPRVELSPGVAVDRTALWAAKRTRSPVATRRLQTAKMVTPQLMHLRKVVRSRQPLAPRRMVAEASV
jgi:hypothetical protein